MPDGDVLSSRVSFAWRPALSLMRGGSAGPAVSPRIAKALVKSLKLRGGIAGLASYGGLVQAMSRGELSLSVARTEARQIGQARLSPNELLVRRAVERCLKETSRPLAADEAQQRIVVGVCHAIMNAELFELARPTLVEQCFASHDEFDGFVVECEALLRPVIERISEQLLSDPSGGTLRVLHNRRRDRVSTEALLTRSVL